MSGTLNLEERVRRRTAERELAKLAETRLKIGDQEIEISKWMLASLLALSGGGALARWNSSILAPSWKIAACMGFLLGLVAALSTTLNIRSANGNILRSLERWEEYWLSVVQGEQNVGGSRVRLDANFNRTFCRTAWPPKVAAISLALFASGGLLAGSGSASAPSQEKQYTPARTSQPALKAGHD